MSAAATIASMVPLCVVIAMRRAEARIHRQLTDAQAVTAESAIQLTLSRAFDGRRLEGLIHGGAVRPTAEGRHFLVADGWADYQRSRGRRALFALAIVLVVVGTVAAVVARMS